MSRTYVQILGFVLALLCMGCAASIPPGAVAMTCSQTTSHFLARSGSPPFERNVCREVKGPDGKTAAVRLLDTRVGHKVYCTEKEGTMTCPSEPLARYTRPSPWTFATPGAVFHRRVLKHMNYDSQDQHGLPVKWCCETITTIFRRALCWSSAMIPAVLSSYKRYPW